MESTSQSIAPSATPAQQQAITSPSAATKSPQEGRSFSGGGPQELFSPTSAAAWALSNLHNFGAAASVDTAPRPSGDSLTGTRLFNTSNVCEDNADGSDPRASSNITFDTYQKGLTNPLPNFTTSDAHSQLSIATSENAWGQPPGAHLLNSHFVDPSPHAAHCNFMPQSISSIEYSMVVSAQYKAMARLVSTTSMVTPTPKKFKEDPAMFAVPSTCTPGAALPSQSASYSRKKKSLGILAENFLNSYRKMPSGSIIVVDEAAIELGVERRRIYDVVNILESVCMVSKKEKNTYSWMGMDQLDVVFGRLQAQAVLEYPEDAQRLLGSDINGAGQGENPPTPVPLKPPRRHSRTKENKSLAKLSQEFLQVFLVGHETLSLPEASDKIQGTTTTEELIIMGGGPDVPEASLLLSSDGVNALQKPDARARELKAAAARGLKTKIRRLYDIANVFLSVGLLRKVDSSDSSRRPSFCWNYKLDARQLHSLYNARTGNKTLIDATVGLTPYQGHNGINTIGTTPTSQGLDQASAMDKVPRSPQSPSSQSSMVDISTPSTSNPPVADPSPPTSDEEAGLV